jgi:hypothetical protein
MSVPAVSRLQLAVSAVTVIQNSTKQSGHITENLQNQYCHVYLLQFGIRPVVSVLTLHTGGKER